MNQALKELARCDDMSSVESGLRLLCANIGPVAKLDVLPLVGAGRRQAICLLRLESSAQEQDLMAKLGAFRFGQDLCVIVDMKAPD